MMSHEVSRRRLLGLLGGSVLAGCGLRGAAIPPEEVGGVTASPAPGRLPPGHELVHSLEFEEQARRVLPGHLYRSVAGGDREPFDRMTFRPRMCIPTVDLDLSSSVLGATLFTPMIVGPIADQRRFHEEGELATIRGAEAAHVPVVTSSLASIPFDEIAERSARGPLWYNVYAADAQAEARATAAVAAGADVLFLTVGTSDVPSGGPLDAVGGRAEVDWGRVDEIRQAVGVPVVLKGILTTSDAAQALEHGAQGLVVSSHGRDDGATTPMDALPAIAEMVDGRVPILMDGSVRRGTDVLKALILGADAVLLARPIVWALSTYGADGVRWVLELMQEELARSMAMLGVTRPEGLTRDHLRIHERATG